MKKLLCACVALTLMCTASLGLASSNRNERLYLLDHIKPLEESEMPATPLGVRHYLLVSMDKWQNNMDNLGYNDGLVLLTMDGQTGRVIVTSIIRDALVIRPDGNPGRINRIIREYGAQGLLDTISRHFGIKVEKYVMMDWRHIMEIVDAVGGVDVPLTSSEIHYMKNWSVPVNSTQPVLEGPGTYHLNGFAAVIFMRIRRTRASNDLDTQDIGRTYRARLVLSSIAAKLSSYDLNSAQNLLTDILKIWEEPYDKAFTYPGIRNNNIFVAGTMPNGPGKKRAETNITMADILDALGLAFSLRGSRVEQCRLPFDNTYRPYEYAKSAGQLMDFEINRALLKDFMFPETFIVSEDPLR
ncbi:MAG: LCP family protein [Eubacteriales bacterium]|nr:LCP family protein [Eubacteriales bacterium]